MRTHLGIEQLANHLQHHHAGARVGVAAHAASVDGNGTHVVTQLARNTAWTLAALFGPEHGIAGLAADMEHVDTAREPATGLPVYSLYGPTVASLRPTVESLRNIDVLVIDLQDIGARYYTYIYTMAFCLQACAERGIPAIVCDRPNPLGGTIVEGTLGDAAFQSFVGWYPLPVRHGMTIGELAHYFNDTYRFGADVTVLPLQHWTRAQLWDDTQLPWVNPSPNMRSLAAAILYPGQCLLEATNISEGRGTAIPFEHCGAPWIDSAQLTQQLAALDIPGIRVDPTTFTPDSRKFVGQLCHGVRLTLTDRDKFPSYRFGLGLLWCLTQQPNFGWRTPAGNPPHSGLDAGPYEFVTTHPAIDLLTGGTAVRTALDAHADWPTIAALVGKPSTEFMAMRTRYLKY